MNCDDQGSYDLNLTQVKPLLQELQILAVDLQALMLMSVETRFCVPKAPRQIEWLSDQGSIYRGTETKMVARHLNLEPPYNGMNEALVRIIKRDYVYVSDCVDSIAVIEMLPKWFDDYNEVVLQSHQFGFRTLYLFLLSAPNRTGVLDLIWS